ncbi:MAG: S8 family serine peptidase [Parvularculaceae bacterium]
MTTGRGRRLFQLAAATALLGACETTVLRPAPASEIAADAEAVVDDRELVVVVKSPSSGANLKRKAARLGYRVMSSERLDGLDLTMLVLAVPEGVTGPVAIAELERAEPGATAGVNHRYTVQEAPLAFAGAATDARAYARALIDWPASGCRARAPIGIIDTAVDAEDPALRDVDVVSRDFRRPRTKTADHAHGTAVAKLIAGDGRLKGARLLVASVVSLEDGADVASTGVASLMRALDWMSAEGVGVANVSLAGPYNKILDRGVQRAASRGLIIVAAAGNDGPDAPPRYPGAFEDALAVTAIDYEASVFADAASGGHIDFAAPGVDVYVPFGEGPRFMTGTSIAAPFVTARIAVDPDALAAGRADAVRKRLAENADDLGPIGRDPVYGEGLIKAPRACGDAA